MEGERNKPGEVRCDTIKEINYPLPFNQLLFSLKQSTTWTLAKGTAEIEGHVNSLFKRAFATHPR